MKLAFWRRLRVVWRRRSTARRRARVRWSRPGAESHDSALADALVALRRVVDEGRVADLALAWFRVDEAKAAAVWYDTARPPAHAAVLPEEQALAERLGHKLTGRPVTAASLLRGEPGLPPMVRYRLLVSRLPIWCVAGGRRAADALRVVYDLMHHSAEVLSPYGRWLLAQAVCRACRDTEELARQTERFRMVIADYRAPDGSSMAFVSGGDFDLPLPVALSEVLDWRGTPTDLEALKREVHSDATQFFMRLTPRGQRLFMQAFRQRQRGFDHGYPWRKPPWPASEGYVFVRTRVHVPAFYVDRRPISNGMFQEFVHRHRLWLPSRVPGYAADRDTYLAQWNGDMPPRSAVADPVTGVSYQAARAYVAASGKRLPTEAEWLSALVGAELPETRYAGADSRPTMTDEERTAWGAKAALRGLHILLPERVFDFDGSSLFPSADRSRVIYSPGFPAGGGAHLWRTPTARGRVPDLAGDANLTFRGVLSARRVWAERR